MLCSVSNWKSFVCTEVPAGDKVSLSYDKEGKLHSPRLQSGVAMSQSGNLNLPLGIFMIEGSLNRALPNAEFQNTELSLSPP
jgi:hypothetical protein